MAKAPTNAPWVRPSPASWNRVWDAAEHYHSQQALGVGGAGGTIHPTDTTKIRIKNASGADRRKGEILKVGDYLLTTINKDLPWFTTALHDGTDAPFCVLLEAIQSGKIGPAQIAGTCPALVNVTQAGQNFARPSEAGTDVLVGEAGLGCARILYPLTGTGELECLIDLSGGRYFAWGVADEDAAEDETKTVSVHTHAGDTGETVEAIFKTAASTGDLVSLALMNNRIYAGCWRPGG